MHLSTKLFTQAYISRLIAFFLVIGLFANSIFANDLIIPGSLLLVDSYAKGMAVTAAENKLEAIYTNPASLVNIEKICMQTAFSSFFEGLYSTQSFTFGLPITDKLKTAFSIPLKQISDLDQTIMQNDVGVKIGSFSDLQLEGHAAAAYELNENISIGITYKYIYHKILNKSAKGYTIDLGCLFKSDLLNIGFILKNIQSSEKKWSSGEAEKFDPLYNVGIALKPLNWLKLYGTYELNNQELKRVFRRSSGQTNLGAEFILNELGINLGIQDFGKSNILGAGLTLTSNDLKLSYAVSLNEALGQSHKIGFTISF
ncbi:hypothetical protein ACFL2K_01200 [Candidatus Margulisiibacteriota bacterium]